MDIPEIISGNSVHNYPFTGNYVKLFSPLESFYVW
jgi:hypothetical protein